MIHSPWMSFICIRVLWDTLRLSRLHLGRLCQGCIRVQAPKVEALDAIIRVPGQLRKDPKVEEDVVPEDTPPGTDGRADPDPLELDEGVGAVSIDDLPDFAKLFGEEGGEEPKEDAGKADEGPGDAKDG